MNTLTIRREFRCAAIALSVVAFWIIAALLVSTTGSLVLKTGVIVLAALAYMRIAGREATIEHALLVGMAWTSMSIVAEIIVATTSHRSWSGLLGAADHAAFRNVLLVTWLAAPAVFARRRS